MKLINTFINEAMDIDSMREYIVNTLSDASKYTRIKDKRLEKAYDIIAMELGEYVDNGPTIEEIDAFFTTRAISKERKKIIRAFKDFDQYDILCDIIKNPSLLPKASDLYASKSGNIFDFFKTYEISGKIIDPQLIFELATEYDGKGLSGESRGCFEIISCLLFQDITKGNKSTNGHGGDIITNSMGAMEYKSHMGRVTNQILASRASFTYAEDKFKELMIDAYGIDFTPYESKINKNKNGYFSNEKQITALGEILFGEYKIKFDDLIPILAEAFTEQYEPMNLKTPLEVDMLRKVLTKHKNDFVKGNSFNAKAIMNIIGSTQTYYYHKKENWDNLVIYQNRNKQGIFSGNFIILDNAASSDIEAIYSNPLLYFTAPPRYLGIRRENMMQINYN